MPTGALRRGSPTHIDPQLLWLRSIGNILNLSTPAGLLVAALGRASLGRGPRGLVLAERYRLGFPRAGAFTVGNVILTGGRWDQLERRYPQLLAHEEVHSWQYLYCLGLPYYLAYTVCLGWSVLRTGDRASANFFERQAGLERGGYVERPARSLRVTARLVGRSLEGVLRRRR